MLVDEEHSAVADVESAAGERGEPEHDLSWDGPDKVREIAPRAGRLPGTCGLRAAQLREAVGQLRSRDGEDVRDHGRHQVPQFGCQGPERGVRREETPDDRLDARGPVVRDRVLESETQRAGPNLGRNRHEGSEWRVD
jgi:hypothetical protein